MQNSARSCENLEQKFSDFPEENAELPALLLHSCCGPCSAGVVEKLAQRFNITLFFANSNITDEEEYKKRLESQKKLVQRFNEAGLAPTRLSLVLAPYAPEAFLESVKGYEDAPEGGARCRICIRDRLALSADYAAMNGFEHFSTTLSISPHKDYSMLSALGRELALRYSLSFLDEDFKKDGGFARSIELAKEYELYRQSYCGCEFSKRDAK